MFAHDANPDKQSTWVAEFGLSVLKIVSNPKSKI